MLSAQALAGIRVLELSGYYGGYCGKLFSGLGADVTLVEPAGGTPLRSASPFANASGESLSFAYQHTNKSSLVLDLKSDIGKSRLAELAASAQLVILADHPDRDQIDFDALQARNPALVCTSITPFGSTGPYADYQADDLTLMAMGGFLCLGGYADGLPTAAYGEQAYRAGDQFAAVASLTAILHAEATGRGEQIDVSIQECVVMALENAAQTYDLEKRIRRREGGNIRTAGTGIYPCKDGEIYLLAAGVGETNLWGNFIDWLVSEGESAATIFANPPWDDSTYRAQPEAIAKFAGVFVPFAMKRTKRELYDGGRKWRVPLAPVNRPSDVLNSVQLDYRGFFVRPPTAAGEGLLMPGAPYKLSLTPWQLHSAAPALADSSHGSPTISTTGGDHR